MINNSQTVASQSNSFLVAVVSDPYLKDLEEENNSKTIKKKK